MVLRFDERDVTVICWAAELHIRRYPAAQTRLTLFAAWAHRICAILSSIGDSSAVPARDFPLLSGYRGVGLPAHRLPQHQRAYPDSLPGQRSGQSGVRLSDRSISPQEVQLEGLFRTHLQHSAMGTRPMPAYARGCRLSVTVL